MSDDEHWSDEDYGDDELQDDWEGILEADEAKAAEETRKQEEAKQQKAALKAKKEITNARKKAEKTKDDRTAEEVSAAVTKARSELLSRAQNKASLVELAGNSKAAAFRGPTELASDHDVTVLVSETAKVVEHYQAVDGYSHFIATLAGELAPKMKQIEVAKLRDHIIALKAEASKTKKVKPSGAAAAKDKTTIGGKAGDALANVPAHAGDFGENGADGIM